MFRQYQSFIRFHAWIIRESFVILHAQFNIEMQDFIFYTPEGNCESPTQHLVENYQVLGIESGESSSKALKRLIENNPWIEENGYLRKESLLERLHRL